MQVLGENWLTVLEHHIQFATFLAVVGYVLRNHSVIVEARRRLNQLWWDHCAQEQEPYTSLGSANGSVVPPHPSRK